MIFPPTKRKIAGSTFFGGRGTTSSESVAPEARVFGDCVTSSGFVALAERFGAPVLSCTDAIGASENEGKVALPRDAMGVGESFAAVKQRAEERDSIDDELLCYES